LLEVLATKKLFFLCPNIWNKVVSRHYCLMWREEARDAVFLTANLQEKNSNSFIMVKTPKPTIPPKLFFEVPVRSYTSSGQGGVEEKKGSGRDDEQESLYSARYRLKKKMREVCKELEETLTELEKTGFDKQKRGKKAGSAFSWKYQFDVYNHSARHGCGKGYEIWRTDTVCHNIRAKARKKTRVRFHTRKEMTKKLQGTAIQREMQAGAWALVDELIEGIPPLKEWAGENMDYKIQFSMMTSGKHVVKAHRDGCDISPQYSICLGDYTGGELLTWEKNRGKEKDPHLATDVKNKLVRFDGRLKHMVAAWRGAYRINIAFYKHYDARWTKEQNIQERPQLVMNFNEKSK
jgi:hypothetical protein